MYKILLLLLLIPAVSSAQLKKLKVFTKETFNPEASITVEESRDPLMAASSLINNLVANGFKVISYRVAQDRAEKVNKGQVTDSSWIIQTSKGKTTYIKSVYVVTLDYQYRNDTGCGGAVMSNLRGQIIDLANDGEIVATFSFSQGMFEGKCTDRVMEALAEALKKK